MRNLFPVALAAALITSIPAQAAKPPVAKAAAAKPAATNWLAAVRRTAEGAIVVGNPAAKVKVVEHLSMTCPHCAALSVEAMAPLKRDYIAKGLVSLEIRHAVLNQVDFVASILLRCEPPARYLDSIEALFATQPQWIEGAIEATSAPSFNDLDPQRKMPAIAKAAGFDTFFAKRGLAPKAQAVCMADRKGQDALSQMASNSWQRDKIPGTPTVLVNGKVGDVHSWADLQPLIQAGLK